MTEKAPYDIFYAIEMLRQAIDYAEADGDFRQARKWANEVEYSAEQLLRDIEPCQSAEWQCPKCG
jgi:hypothetical protein